MLKPGKRLGPYEILAPLGAGGMGEVYKARDTRLERSVAVKVLPPEFAKDAEYLTRFEREARAVAAFSHPNILAVYDVGEEGDVPYLVTELLEGESLRERLNQGPMPPSKAQEIALQVARGLAAAHAKGIVHRDLKPANVFLAKGGHVKILDFGLAKLVSSGPLKDRSDPNAPTDGSPTHAGTILGTLDYMSPEQVRGLPADPRSDIFAFGVVLYEMLAGRRAFSRDSAADTLSAILHEDPPELDRLSSGISIPLVRIVRRCLEKRPEDRFSSAQDLGFALETISGVEAAEAPPERKARRHRRQSAPKGEVAEGPAFEPTSIFPRAKEEAERLEQEHREEESRSRRAEESKKRRAEESRRRRAEESGKRRERGEKSRGEKERVAEQRAFEEEALLRASRREKVAAAILLALLFLVNYAETAVETWLRVRYGAGAELEKSLGEAAQWFERGLSFEQHDATNMIAVYGFSAVYFFLFPLLALLTVAAFARRKDSRPLLLLATAAVADYLLTLPFYLLFPVPERWTFPDANAVLLSDLWTSNLIQAFRPFSGLNNCFPSFHVSTTVILVACLYRYRAAFRTAAIPTACAILLSTFVLGIHWLPDILAGLAAGWLSFWLAEKLLPLVQREIGAGVPMPTTE